MKKVDLRTAIDCKKEEIQRRKENSNLTEEQIRAGRKLVDMENLVREETGAEQHARKKIFEEMGSLLGYDFKESIAIERERQVLDILEETYEAKGICIETESEFNMFYAFSAEKYNNGMMFSAYRFDEFDFIEDIKFEDIDEGMRNKILKELLVENE